jgi:hypothetical protein
VGRQRDFVEQIALIAQSALTQYHSGHVVLCCVALLAFPHYPAPAILPPKGIQGDLGRFDSPKEFLRWVYRT